MLGKKFGKTRRETALCTDKRVTVMSDVLHGMRGTERDARHGTNGEERGRGSVREKERG